MTRPDLEELLKRRQAELQRQLDAAWPPRRGPVDVLIYAAGFAVVALLLIGAWWT